MTINKNTLKVLEWDKITEDLSGYSTCETGKNRCLEIELRSDINIIKHELKLTSEARFLLDRAVYPPIAGINNTCEAVNIAKTGQTLNNSELISIGKNLEIARQVKNFFRKYREQQPLIYEITEGLTENQALEREILDIFDDSGDIISSASPELKNLTTSLKDQADNLKNRLNRFINTPDALIYLQNPIYTIRNDRFVVPVKVEHKSHVSGMVHDVSSSGATVFIEPGFSVELNNRIKETEIKIDAEIRRILSELSRQVKENTEILNLNLDLLTEIDFIFAKARYSIFLNGIEPSVNSEKFISFKKVKHPVLMKILEKVTPNDIEIGKDFQIMLITGPNTGGKTVILKTVGLCVLMTKAGLHIPADEADIYPFLKIFADIGDEQNITQSLSTFSGHIKNIVEILENTDENTLIFLDEVGAGTDPMEGTALAEALMENIRKKKAKALITTHFSELKALAYTKEGFYNASVEFDTETLSPTYRLLMGIPGKSNAISIAGKLGLDQSIIEEARHNYLNKKDPTGKALEGLQDTQQKLTRETREIEEKKLSIEELERNYNAELEKLKSEKKKIIHVYRKKFDAVYFEAKEEINHILEETRKNRNERSSKGSISRLGGAISEARKLDYEETEKLEPEYEPLNWEKAAIGDCVYIKTFAKEGILSSLPDKNDVLQVEIGVLKTKVSKQEVFKPKKSKFLKKELNLRKGFKFEKTDMTNTLDLRGERVEEALTRVDYFLDKANLANFTPVYIIHGHGTGKLRKAIREHLKTSGYVKNFRAGKDGEGGDGITVVELL
ncbi:MAG TPA: endonuclease MutS2 [Candidatus Gastranaerophilales bacterium]|nr:endonuclease MutS2 [Candidatus Gastranaerophilales bacterium]